MESPPWMSTREAAERLGVHPKTVYRLIDEGELPAYKFGRVIRLLESEVEKFVEDSRIVPGTLDHHLATTTAGSLHRRFLRSVRND